MRSLGEDVELVRGLIADRRCGEDRLVVVGHSYGGVVISAAAHTADHLVYVAAIAPEADQSAADSAAGGFGLVPGLDVDEATGQTRLTTECTPYLYGMCSEADRDWALSLVRPFPARCILEPIAGEPAWRTVPSTYVVCTEDRVLTADYQRERAGRLTHSVELVADHSPFLSAPDELAAAVITAAVGARS